MFCESLAEFLKLNRSIKKLDISCNFIDNSNAATLKDSLEGNPNIIEMDVRNNQLAPETEEEIREIITKNYLASKNIPYQKIGKLEDEASTEEKASPIGNSPGPKGSIQDNASPSKTNNEAD
jgi:hypothetical protein